MELITKSYQGNASVPIDIAPTAQPVMPPSAPGTQENLKPSTLTKMVLSPAENDVTVQWYLPSLDEYAVMPQKVLDLTATRSRTFILNLCKSE